MQHFQSILIVIGLLAIGGVLIHGYLVSRKEKQSASEGDVRVDIFAEKSSPQETPQESDGVLGEVRIISNEGSEPEPENIDFSQVVDDDQIEPIKFDETEEVVQASIKVDELAPETVDVIEEAEELKVVATSEEQDTVEIVSPVEPEVVADEKVKADSEATDKVAVQPQDLFIFNVVAREDNQLGGHELLQFFLTSGFRFGEMSIFHRHQESDGTGPVLFSIANMMAPGIFDVDNMEQFKSEGVSFFLTAPNKDIDIKKSFDMMLRAVEQMAEEFDCDVLNAEREPLTKAQFIEYNNRLLRYI
ncbi:cell division protein ZipA [Psychromonas sp. psych-6C06]|uniref:cell division protein ZipA n=1 Tax=Psychromonas sp. psych-6C06 TaxID=2058089 RepID=UPI000C347630|nr:cell division protein ZipA [Psychromonas sp. psych-6C06]PKF60390.1 cell division protein ZipA [Psychromonas sp. psych-6C06]